MSLIPKEEIYVGVLLTGAAIKGLEILEFSGVTQCLKIAKYVSFCIDIASNN